MKKLSIHFLLTIFIFTLGFSCNQDSSSENPIENIPETTIETTQLLNVAYGNDNNQVYDIYLPENRTLNTKIIILIHGGGWSGGDKLSMNDLKNKIREDLPDYAVVNMNYRLASQGVSPFPMQLNDITAVVNHLKNNASSYLISDKIGFIGSSAGAHIALLWSYDYNTDNNTNMVASIVGPTNLADEAYTDNEQLAIPQLMQFFGETPTTAFLETNSPLHKVTTSAPATILFYGGSDPLIPTSQGVDLDAKLTTLGVTHEFTLYPNEGHAWIGESLYDTWIKTKAFIIAHH